MEWEGSAGAALGTDSTVCDIVITNVQGREKKMMAYCNPPFNEARDQLTNLGSRIGYWLLVIGYWLLVIGYWLLVIGHW